MVLKQKSYEMRLSFCERDKAYKGYPMMGTGYGSLFAKTFEVLYETWIVVFHAMLFFSHSRLKR
jgi:hypothetical protein